jgi:hypothetical protein
LLHIFFIFILFFCTGSFEIDGWASNAADVNFASVVIIATSTTTPEINTVGGILPAYNAPIATLRIESTTITTGVLPIVPPAIQNIATLTITANPANGALTQFTGILNGITVGITNYCIVLYALDGMLYNMCKLYVKIILLDANIFIFS